jgi:exosortase E/protease (VPEID-CTERM system)
LTVPPSPAGGTNASEPPLTRSPPPGLSQRILLLALILGAEAWFAFLFLDGEKVWGRSGDLAALMRNGGGWLARGAIGFAALCATFAYLKHRTALECLPARAAAAVQAPLIAAHAASVAVFAALSAALVGTVHTRVPPDYIAAACAVAAVAAVASAGLALLPQGTWGNLLRATGRLWAYAAGATALAALAGPLSRGLWMPATRLTYALVNIILHPLVRDMVVQPEPMRIGTHRFTVIVTPECSGLEGAALLLVFGVFWLVLFRREFRFPQAMLLLPAAVGVLFVLNAVRIAVLILIGHAGAPEVAARGFHSQAGWIAFNAVAFGFSIAASRLAWFSAPPLAPVPATDQADNPIAPYLVPFLAILAAGMLSKSVSGEFEWLYSLRFFAAAGALWFYRRSYREIAWRPGWLAPAVGAAVFLLWIALDRLAAPAGGSMPPSLVPAAPAVRVFWIALRVLAAVVTVPIAEELAFRGFLLRRLISARFQTVPFRQSTIFSVLGSSLVFGLLHGERWPAGTAAGVLYALSLRLRGRLGDAILAHAITNALLAAWVLAFRKWYLW